MEFLAKPLRKLKIIDFFLYLRHEVATYFSARHRLGVLYHKYLRPERTAELLLFITLKN
jgi:hypothetical protein